MKPDIFLGNWNSRYVVNISINLNSYFRTKTLNVGQEFSYRYKIILDDSQQLTIDDESLNLFQDTLLKLLIKFDREHMQNKQQFSYVLGVNVCFQNLGMKTFI